MSDYISKSALIEILEKSMKENNHKSMIGYAEHIQEHRYLIHLVEKQPTLDEKEIIRKAFERVVERLNEIISNLDNKNKICMDIGDFKSSDRYSDRMCEVIKCKEIVMEEGGIE